VNTANRILSMQPLFEKVLEDVNKNVAVSQISAKTHNSLAYIILNKCKQLLLQTGAKKVVLSGGCFQNKRLPEHLQLLFSQAGITLYVPSRIPCNDSGIAVGQVAVAAETFPRLPVGKEQENGVNWNNVMERK
jgi:hydrogenase maturation protein HypF